MTRTAAELHVEWRYKPGRKVAHGLGAAGDSTARCGAWVWGASFWMGTGSQHEYETCAALPRCKRCVKGLTADGRLRGAS